MVKAQFSTDKFLLSVFEMIKLFGSLYQIFVENQFGLRNVACEDPEWLGL